MSRLDPVLSLVGYPGPGELEAAVLLDHLESRLGREGRVTRLAPPLDGFERQRLAHSRAP